MCMHNVFVFFKLPVNKTGQKFIELPDNKIGK